MRARNLHGGGMAGRRAGTPSYGRPGEGWIDCVYVTVADQAVTKVEPVPAADHSDDCSAP